MVNREQHDQGYNDLAQVQMAIESAQHMVGQATVNMDEGQLKAATDALNQAKEQYQKAASHQNGMNAYFFETSSEILGRAEQQLTQAKKKD
ncbi:hypothetical protein AJ85_07730 [Alkalihalobacillus alcalophilus ATCC 27647 = CGMCC 1.3604]|uniref:Cytosolic protein n=1 Tax=Alkalihalobacillus alcalophilus ATCC 27647 = CGMCC 1.3604 TaxID=1218173 RepID=A0A094WL49_ALKAL|nr:DUF2564 family protein [Alkalihalobacillus alcalophilus]KGA96663.1 hypothetical protein BALCAV_0214910 [Alkalihalobacillus alcalophilus ATCC 27647 = CGMCC 1.3604]MED1561825.1 DUF2564 family protein [Alkalihalobacillus alcalophilus]THG90990.1 hypothetical protein AJ85_07730 [Alkalihalobacillus alcalophilus ATCC 27647 = CGMCC 1.3604]